MKKIFGLSVIILISFSCLAHAGNEKEDKDSIAPLPPVHKNTIKFNPTPMLLWGEMRNFTLSYERVVRPNQSFSIQLGYLVFPKIIEDTVAKLIALTDRQKLGINISADYRFYPMKRNRRPIPDGLYYGPYASYYGNYFENKFDILTTTADQHGNVKCNISIVNVGFQLGYQFILWKRLSIDLLLFGPSISYYYANLRFETTLDKEELEDITEEVVDKLIDRFPAIGTLFSGEKLTKTGVRSSISLGFRYSLSIGFHF
jgi:hypothetical protein